MNKLSIRFGVRLSWPIKNAAIFVTKVTNEQYGKIIQGVEMLKGALPSDIAERIVLELR